MDIQTLKPRYITDESGKKTEIVLSLEVFNQLIEDIEDLQAIAERKDEESVPHEEFLAELKSNGLL
jgi:hypothetical protein